MRRKGLRRLEIWLPEVHPIWNLPAGRRAEKVRELLELGMRLEQGLDALRRDIAAEISALRRDLEAMRHSQSSPAAPGSGGVSAEAAKKFLAAFD